MLNKDDITSALKEEYDYYIQQYSKNRILGTFVIGKGNYGFAKTINDLHFITIYLPTFDELCIGKPKHIYQTTEHGVLLDMRRVYTISVESDMHILEILFSDYCIITPKYRTLFTHEWLNKRNTIARYNEKMRLTRAYECAQKAANEHDIFEVLRLYQGAYLYSMNADVYTCFHPSNPLDIYALNSALNETNNIDVEDVLNRMQVLVDEAPDTTNVEAMNLIKQGTIDLITASLQESVSYDTFISCLTKTENDALLALQSKLTDGAGNISISKIIEETGISRPVWKNLFLKMESNNIATIKNEGVKGTYIKLLD